MATRRLVPLVLGPLALAAPLHAQVLGPTPYLSAADSPFQPAMFQGYFYLEDVEDGLFNVPGVSASTGGPYGPGLFTDSVDGDDGSIDGSGLQGRSYLIGSSGNPHGYFYFSGTILGHYPTHVGIVLTDAHDPVFVEAFDPSGTLYYSTTVTGFGPNPDTQGQTAEDRFVGFVDQTTGISSIHVWTSGGGGLEVDHLQYGFMPPNYTPFCAGDGQNTLCPCANHGAFGAGCASSVNPAGARLLASGSPSISNDSLVLEGSGMPDSAALYFQGTTRVNGGSGEVFGDGLRCAGGSIVRLGTETNVGGTSRYPAAGEFPISVRGVNAPGDTRTYQVWYRNAAAFCTPAVHNLTNGYEIAWGQ